MSVAALAQALHPFECISVNEIVILGVDLVEQEIFAAPIEVFAREVEVDGCGSCTCRADRERAGV